MAGFATHGPSVREARPRHYVSHRTIRLLRLVGFRRSLSRGAYVLRGIGWRFGPVFKPRPEQREPVSQ